MKPAVLLACLLVLLLGDCSWIPRAGPSTSEVVEQSRPDGQILFDVVEVDDRVVSTLLGEPKQSFAARFQSASQPPPIKIAIGDTISVSIWESAAGGLFFEAPPPATGSRPGIEPLAPESQPATGERQNEIGAPSPPVPPFTEPQAQAQPGVPAPGILQPEAYGLTPGRHAAVIPDQQVGSDGAISVPYADRIPAADRSPAEVQQTIEMRLAEKALQPQALVIVKNSEANAVTVTGEVIAGARIPLSPGGTRLLEAIAAAGGIKAPANTAVALAADRAEEAGSNLPIGDQVAQIHDVFVRLSRGGTTVTIPLQQLVSNPAEDIYAQPGDVLTLIRVPQTFSVFGATGRNAEIPFNAERLTLSEALGKSQGLRDDLAKPEGVFLFRYEPNSVVRALDQPIASGATGGVSPVVYRFNLRDGKSYLLAQQFPVEDKDVIFVADAPAAQTYKFATVLNQITGPIITGLVTCHYSANC